MILIAKSVSTSQFLNFNRKILLPLLPTGLRNTSISTGGEAANAAKRLRERKDLLRSEKPARRGGWRRRSRHTLALVVACHATANPSR
jgi:hypothetical protein